VWLRDRPSTTSIAALLGAVPARSEPGYANGILNASRRQFVAFVWNIENIKQATRKTKIAHDQQQETATAAGRERVERKLEG